MDPESRAKRQHLKVVISESIMVISVIITVIILAFLVSGYHINSDFEVERQGMLQIHSVPTGANVEVDGESPWFQRTNTSKVLSVGEHEIELTKDGYDTWSKTVTISEGLLYRVHYPRLFLLEREKETVYEPQNFTYATVSPDRKYLLLVSSTPTWTLSNLDGDKIKETLLDFSETMPAVNILSAEWNRDNNKLLIHTDNSAAAWVLLNINNPTESVNLTRDFANITFDSVRVFDNSASSLLAMQGGNLYKIDVSGKKLSNALLKNVMHYSFYGNELVYTAKTAEKKYTVGLLKVGDETATKLLELENPARVYLTRFYDEKYITVLENEKLSIYTYNNFDELFSEKLSFVPAGVKIGINNDFIFLKLNERIAVLDMETLSVKYWTLAAENYGWLDDSMLYAVSGGVLSVYDFDGLNRRELTDNVTNSFPVTITADKWLYYLSNNKLTREKIN